jgi:peptidoglycan hydrolase-like protein with peptidoglycan-binding domain
MRPARGIGASVLIVAALAAQPQAAGATSASVAALQSALQARGLYAGYVDGVRGPLTRRATVRLQQRRGLLVDGIAGPQTRRALGWRGRPRLGARALQRGRRGWDVAALQFLLQRRGYGPGAADGVYGGLTAAAVLRAQRAAGVAVDGVAGPVTISTLRDAAGASSGAGTPTGPVAFLRPVSGPIGDGFGAPRTGDRHHQGLDFPVPYGTRVGAAGRGTTIFAGNNSDGYGNLVVIQHRLGYTSWYGHLSQITTWVGEQVVGGTRIGYVGSTGYSSGPHLHFEVRRYDTPIDPAPRLLTTVAARKPDPRANRAVTECAGAERRAQPAPSGSSWIAREPLCRPRRSIAGH